MMLQESTYAKTSCVMEGYRHYLTYNRGVTQFTARTYVNVVRRFHNYFGKPYVDITHDDIEGYLNYIIYSEQRTSNSVIRHLAAIKKFYAYLTLRGEIDENPCIGICFYIWRDRV